jgi:hypothetical protein
MPIITRGIELPTASLACTGMFSKDIKKNSLGDVIALRLITVLELLVMHQIYIYIYMYT